MLVCMALTTKSKTATQPSENASVHKFAVITCPSSMYEHQFVMIFASSIIMNTMVPQNMYEYK